jgi:hypothetical protein
MVRSSTPSTAMLIVALLAAAATIGHDASAGERHKRYFVEFRARPGTLLGHTYVVYGRLDRYGRMHDIRYAGLYPRTDGKAFVLVSPRAKIRGGVEADIRQPAAVVYRKQLTASEFARMRVAIQRVRATEHYWHLVFYNCNDFAIEVAESLGLVYPPGLLFPQTFVATLRALNEG